MTRLDKYLPYADLSMYAQHGAVLWAYGFKGFKASEGLHFNKGSYWILSAYPALCIRCKAYAMIITKAGKGLIQDRWLLEYMREFVAYTI